MREDVILNGVRFLTHPSIIPRAPEDKAQYLSSKGLTQEEIDEAWRRANATIAGNPALGGAAAQPQASVPQQQPGSVPAAPVPQYVPQGQPVAPDQPLWSKVLVPATLTLSAGAGLAYLYKTFLDTQGPPGGNNNGGPGGNPGNAPSFPWETPGLLQPPPLMMNPPPGPMGSGAPPGPAAPAGSAAAPAPTNPNEALINGTSPASSDKPWLVPYGGKAPTGSTSGAPPTSSTPPLGAMDSYQAASLKRSMDEQSSSLRDIVSQLKEVTQGMQQQSAEVKSAVTILSSRSPTPSAGAGMDNNQLQLMLSAMQGSSDLKAELSSIKTLLLASLMRSPASGSGDASTMLGGNGPLSASTLAELSAIAHQPPSTPAAALQDHFRSGSVEASPGLLDEQGSPVRAEEEPQQPEVPAGPVVTKLTTEGIEKARTTLAAMITGNLPPKEGEEETEEEKPKPSAQAIAKACDALLLYINGVLKAGTEIKTTQSRFRHIRRGNPHYVNNIKSIPGHLEFLESIGFQRVGATDAFNLELSPHWCENLTIPAELEGTPTTEERWAHAIFTDVKQNLSSAAAAAAPPPAAPSKPLVPHPVSTEPKASPPPAPWSASTTPAPAAPPAAESTPPSSETASEHLDFSEVMRRYQAGQELPGIKKISQATSSDPPSTSTAPPPPKPYETSTPTTTASFADFLAEQRRKAEEPKAAKSGPLVEILDE